MNRIKKGINPKVAEIGKIKIGEHSVKKTQSGYHLPKRLDYFRIVTTEKDSAKINFLEDKQVMDTLGKEPKEIKILVPFDDVDMNFQTSFALYAGRQCICRGDGFEADRTFLKDGKPGYFTLLDSEDLTDTVKKNERRKVICDPETCPHMQKEAKQVCKPNGRLCTIIPASKRLNGYYFFRTTSWNSISFITKALDDMKDQSGGILKGIPMKLFFFKKNTDSHGNVPVVSIDWDFDDMEKFYKGVEDQRLFRIEHKINIKAIEDKARQSGILEDTEDPAEVEQEFYSQNTEEFQETKKKISADVKSRADSVLDAVTEEIQPEEEVKADESGEPLPEASNEEKEAEPVKPDDKGADGGSEQKDKSDLSLF